MTILSAKLFWFRFKQNNIIFHKFSECFRLKLTNSVRPRVRIHLTAVLRCRALRIFPPVGVCRHSARIRTRRSDIYPGTHARRQDHALMIVMNINMYFGANEPENSILTTHACHGITLKFSIGL